MPKIILNYPRNTDAATMDRLDNAPESVKANAQHVIELYKRRLVEIEKHQREDADLLEKIVEQSRRVAAAEHEESKAGREYYKEERKAVKTQTGEIGYEVVRTNTGYVGALKQRLEDLKAARVATGESPKVLPFWNTINEGLRSAAPFALIPMDPIGWTPETGESFLDGAKREVQKYFARYETTQSIVRQAKPVAEAINLQCERIDELANSVTREAVEGFFRGAMPDHRGAWTFRTMPDFNFPEVFYPQLEGGGVHVPNLLAFMAWYDRAKLKKLCADFTTKNFKDAPGLIPSGERPAALKDAQAAEFDQMRVAEAAIKTAERHGFKPPRPTSFPWQVLVDAMPGEVGAVADEPATEKEYAFD